MTQTVAEVITTLEHTIKKLKKQDPSAEVLHVLMPDGGYSGDYESTFHKIDVEGPEPDDEGDESVTLLLHY